SGQKDQADVVAMYNTLVKNRGMKWQKNKGKPDLSYEDLLAREQKTVEDLRRDNTKKDGDVKRLAKKVEDLEGEVADGKKAFEAQLAAAKKKSDDDHKQLIADNAKL